MKNILVGKNYDTVINTWVNVIFSFESTTSGGIIE